MNLYVMRHGTTVWNEQKITQGRSQNRLSKNGVELTKQVAKEYANTPFDLIICSPLMRTVQTANIMNQYHHTKIVKEPLLIEIDQGIFTGRYFFSLTEEELILKNEKSPKAKMESWENIFKRAQQFSETLNSYRDYENVLVITHDCVASMLELILLNKKIDLKDNSLFRNFKNAEVKKFVI